MAGQGKADGEHDIAVGLLLEGTVAIGEGAGGAVEDAHFAALPVIGHEPMEASGQFGTKGADILDRRRAGRAWDQRKIFDAAKTLFDAPGDEIVPDLAGGGFNQDMIWRLL